MTEPHDHRLSDHHSLEEKVEHLEEVVEEAAEAVVENIEGAMEATLPMHLRLQAWARRRPATHAVWRAAVLVVGLVVFGVGIAGLALPVLPGWILIFVGLAILASEFTWAHAAYKPVRKGYDWAVERAKRRGKNVD